MKFAINKLQLYISQKSSLKMFSEIRVSQNNASKNIHKCISSVI